MTGAIQSVFMNQRSFGPPPGQDAFTTVGTFTWVAPAGVTKVSLVAIAGGKGGTSNPGTGGNLSYVNNQSVSGSYTVLGYLATGLFIAAASVGVAVFARYKNLI